MDEDNATMLKAIYQKKGEVCDLKDSKKLSHKLLLFFSKGDEAFQRRIHFLISYIHALGGSALVILSALVFLVIKKYRFLIYAAQDLKNWNHQQVFQLALGFLWTAVTVIFWLAREPVKDSFKISKEVLAESQS